MFFGKLLLLLSVAFGVAEAAELTIGGSRALQGQQSSGSGCPLSLAAEQCEICSQCNKNKPESLTFIYRPNASRTSSLQGEKATCVQGSYPQTPTVTVAGQSFNLRPGAEFTVNAPNGAFDANTVFQISGFGSCIIHLSCSVPIVTGDVIGPFEVKGPTEQCTGGSSDCASPGCEICAPDNKDTKPTQLTFIYRRNGSNSSFQPEDKASCRAGTYPATATLVVEGQTITVSAGEEFTVSSADGDSLPANLEFVFQGNSNFNCFIHSSCSVPIVVGDRIGPFEIVGADNACRADCGVCVDVPDRQLSCAEPISINFDYQQTTDILGQATGPLPDDWIGIYPCDVPFSESTFFFPITYKYVCDQFVGQDSAACARGTKSYPSGTVVIDRLPSYGAFGPHIWPVAPFRSGGVVKNQFKAVLMRNDGPSVPPYVPICESACFTISANPARRDCQVRNKPNELPAGAPGVCFPGDAVCNVEGKGEIMMKNIQLGDKVLTEAGIFEKVYSFGHRKADVNAEYIRLVTSAASLELSKEHMVIIGGGRRVPASMVKAGDSLELANGDLSKVISTKSVTKKGAYAPFTSSGNIVVNGVKASTFVAYQDSETLLIGGFNTGLTYQFLAHASELPHRMWCSFFFSCSKEEYTVEGVNTRVSGQHKAAIWAMSQDSIVMWLVLAPVATLLCIIGYPVTTILGLLTLVLFSRVRVVKQKVA